MSEEFNLESIRSEVLNTKAGWMPGPTPLTDLPPDERRRRLGYTPGPQEPSLQEREFTARMNAEAYQAGMILRGAGTPVSFDWRNRGGQNFVSPVVDQGSCGSCVSFGTITTVEARARIQANDPNHVIDLSEAQLFYCHARSQGRMCNDGWWVDPALNCMMDPGVADDASYPYSDVDQNCSNLSADWQDRVVKVGGWHRINSVADMKTWLSTNGPLVACYTVYSDFYAYRGGIYRHVTGGVEGGHCVATVGYDDTEGYWICKNSWASTWGESGFFRIGYGEVGIDATMWAVDSVVVTEPTWQTNVSINGLWATSQANSAWVYVNTLGWKRIDPSQASALQTMLTQLAAAKAGNRPVNLRIEQNLIKEVYVW